MYLKRDYIVCWIDNLNKNVGPFVKGFCRNLAEYWFMELEWQTEIKPKIFTSHNNAIDFLKTISVDHALIINIGNDLEGDYPQFLKALDEYILDDDILIGHILDKNDRYYELHEQLYYLNVKKWKAIGCPSLGKTGIDITYNIPNKSKENHHDNYTPYWINQGSNNKLYTNVKHGHNLIAKILETDTKIRSFPEHIRKTKEYFYPNENDCNDAIYGFINKNLSSKFYPINTEQLHLEEVNVIKNLQGMITVASGLNHFKIIKHTGYTKNFKLMFCDYDEYALYMMKQIYENWDGTNYKNFIKKVDVLHNCKEMASRIDFDKFIEWVRTRIKMPSDEYKKHGGHSGMRGGSYSERYVKKYNKENPYPSNCRICKEPLPKSFVTNCPNCQQPTRS